MSTDLTQQPKAPPASLAFRQRTTAIASELLKQWVGEERVGEAVGRITTALAAAAAAAKDPSEFYSCTPASVGVCVATAALTGIMPGIGPGALAYVQPQRPRKDDPPQLQYMLSHRGLNALAARAEMQMIPIPIGMADEIKLLNDGNCEIVRRDPDNVPTTFDDLRGVAVVVNNLANGRVVCTGWVPKKLIEPRRAMSRSYNGSGQKYSPWYNWPVEMAMKGLAVDTPIPTPDGWTTMGELNIGDEVFDMNGQQTSVVGVSEVKHLDCYRITFANGDEIVCDSEHRWFATIGTAGCRQRRNGWPVFGIAELYDAKQRGEIVSVPVSGPLECGWSDLPVHPWLLGYWIGNGNRTKASVTCHAQDVDELRSRIEEFSACAVGSVRRDPRSQACSIGLRGVLDSFREIGALGCKLIPPKYLRSSRENRELLLCGLVDSDGHVEKRRGRVIYSTVDESIADQVYELVVSLGETASRRSYTASGYGRRVQSHTVTWTPRFQCCTLSRKVRRLQLGKRAAYRGVRSIDKIAPVPTRCIAVASETQSYLAGRGMVPTHNTAMKYAISRGWCIIDDTSAMRALAAEEEMDVIPTTGHVVQPERRPLDSLLETQTALNAEAAESAAHAAVTESSDPPPASEPASRFDECVKAIGECVGAGELDYLAANMMVDYSLTAADAAQAMDMIGQRRESLGLTEPKGKGGKQQKTLV